jgi:hypothetical protein
MMEQQPLQIQQRVHMLLLLREPIQLTFQKILVILEHSGSIAARVLTSPSSTTSQFQLVLRQLSLLALLAQQQPVLQQQVLLTPHLYLALQPMFGLFQQDGA